MAKDQLKGKMMECRDRAFPILKEIRKTTQFDQSFLGCDITIFVGAKLRRPDMERKDLLADSACIFKEQGDTLEKYASKKLRFWLQKNKTIQMPQSQLILHQTYYNLTLRHSLVQIKIEPNPSLLKVLVQMLRLFEIL